MNKIILILLSIFLGSSAFSLSIRSQLCDSRKRITLIEINDEGVKIGTKLERGKSDVLNSTEIGRLEEFYRSEGIADLEIEKGYEVKLFNGGDASTGDRANLLILKNGKQLFLFGPMILAQTCR